jgi:hypothetical protein
MVCPLLNPNQLNPFNVTSFPDESIILVPEAFKPAARGLATMTTSNTIAGSVSFIARKFI